MVSAVLLVIWCLRPWIRWANSYIYLTTERIVTKRGRRAAGQHSIGLYAIHDIVAVVRPNAPQLAPGTLSIVLADQRFNIPHVPAVARMRGYCIGAITALPHFARVDGVNMEEGADGEPPARPTNEAHHQHDQQHHQNKENGLSMSERSPATGTQPVAPTAARDAARAQRHPTDTSRPRRPGSNGRRMPQEPAQAAPETRARARRPAWPTWSRP